MRASPLLRLSLVVALASCGGDGPGTSSSQDSLTVVCIKSTACQVQSYPRVSNCVSYYLYEGKTHVLDPIYRCAAKATGCAQVEACYGATESCDQSYPARCESGRAYFCDLIDEKTRIQDCAAAGVTCQLDPKYSHAASCAGGKAGHVPQLSTDAPCEQGLCQRTGLSCTVDQFDRCAGTGLEVCLDAEWIRFDCAQLGLGPCEETSTGVSRWGHCTAPK